MNRASLGLFLVLTLILAPRYGACEDFSWPENAAQFIVRIPADSLAGLPSEIVNWIHARGYLVPQVYEHADPHNAISGNYDEDKQRDWAVLCSRGDSSWIAVFWEGTTDSVDLVDPRADEGFLQGIGGGKIGYSRYLATVSADGIRYLYESWEEPIPEGLTHDGIEDAFWGKGSGILYWDRGRMRRLRGSD
jgi:hypothetical protein